MSVTSTDEEAVVAIWTVYADWDAANAVWVSRASDMPGLNVDAPTVDELARKAAEHVSSLLQINADLLTPDDRAGPHSVRVVAHHERALPVAA
ncbi:DUF1902 domain-containing protein [Sandaracinobacteroides saxicola]|uniref:DUF1902 domain-containing protein n=1 Tax=Sandaracinobacteroides saxicola TaxID=2759707 RepID=A0A7G5IEM0_9SPHN|nr:DUF1902 domain-containing protein [Sandaracinobacteroides saxicola]QMW21812.1 DUF1902 domain-containing protein [Sandaracinobacteroides saxicola]